MSMDLSRAESNNGFNAQILLEKIITGDLNLAIDMIVSEIHVLENHKSKLSLSLICYDYHDLKEQINRGIITKEDEFLERRKIVNRLLEQILQVQNGFRLNDN